MLSQGREFDLGSTAVLNVRFIPEGRIAGTYHGELVIYDGRLRRIQAHEGQLLSLFYDRGRIYTGGSDGYLRLRKASKKVAEIELGDYVYGVRKHPKGLIAITGAGEVYLVDPELKGKQKVFEYDRPARDLVVIPGLEFVLVGFYDGTIVVFDRGLKERRRILRTLGDSVTFLDVDKDLGAVLAGFRSGRISLIYFKQTSYRIRSGRRINEIVVKPRDPIDLQTVGSVTRRIGLHNGYLMALGGNGTLYFQTLEKLLKAALSTRGTRIVARRRERLHEYGANGAHMENDELITAGHDGLVRIRNIGEEV